MSDKKTLKKGIFLVMSQVRKISTESNVIDQKLLSKIQYTAYYIVTDG